MRTIHTKIVGVTYSNSDGSSRQDILATLCPGMQLRLMDAASEKYPEAIAIYTTDGKQCGHISADLAASLREDQLNFTDLPVFVCEVTGGSEGRSYGCNIEIQVQERETIKAKLVSVKQSEADLLNEGDSLNLVDLSIEKDTDAIGVSDGYAEPFAKLNRRATVALRALDADFENFDVTVTRITLSDNGKYDIYVEIDLCETLNMPKVKEREPVVHLYDPYAAATSEKKPEPMPEPRLEPEQQNESFPVPPPKPQKQKSGCCGPVFTIILIIAALLYLLK